MSAAPNITSIPRATRRVIDDLRREFGATAMWCVEANFDCSNAGPAVAWWRASQAGDTAGQRLIEETAGHITLFAGAVEMSLAMASWGSRNDHTSNGDQGVSMLAALSGIPSLHPYERLHAATCGACVAGSTGRRNRKRPSTVIIPSALPPHEAATAALGVMTVIANLLEHRFKITGSEQADAFTRVLASREAERAI